MTCTCQTLLESPKQKLRYVIRCQNCHSTTKSKLSNLVVIYYSTHPEYSGNAFWNIRHLVTFVNTLENYPIGLVNYFFWQKNDELERTVKLILRSDEAPNFLFSIYRNSCSKLISLTKNLLNFIDKDRIGLVLIQIADFGDLEITEYWSNEYSKQNEFWI